MKTKVDINLKGLELSLVLQHVSNAHLTLARNDLLAKKKLIRMEPLITQYN